MIERIPRRWSNPERNSAARILASDANCKYIASITYYLLNQKRLDAYIEEGRKAEEAACQEQLKNPSPGIARLMKIAAEAKAARLSLRELSE